jgi:RNA polymerase sigma-54 factor
MKLSPRMIQSMEILQLPTMALEERIAQELTENPVLEMVEEEPDGELEGNAASDGATDERTGEQPMVVEDGDTSNSRDDFHRLDDMAEQYGQVWEENTSSSAEYRPRVREDGERDGKMDAMANTAARAASLSEQLLDQWRFTEIDPDTRRAGEHLISFIDDDGYLRADEQQILQQAPPDVTAEQLRQARTVLQQRLEPSGLGARNLPECLMLQIDAAMAETDDPDDEQELTIARRLVADHLQDIEMNRLPRIARQSGLTMEQVQGGLARLRRLDPRPGRRLAPDRPQVVVPDVVVEYDPVHDRYVAALNYGRQPSLRINPVYSDLSRDRRQDRDTRDFVNQKVSSARWLIDSIEQRNNTLLRVVNVVIEVQRDFLDHGPEHLKPLPMIQVADQLGIHVGTVSRAVSEKYLQTPRGIFPLRMFFSGGTESDAGEEMSWTAVQAKLKQIIESEDSKKPWSDDQLAEQLKQQGVEIARRTVAKYRQQMNIPPAQRRRQY